MAQDRYVLIVDDDDAILETIREALEDEGYTARTLNDGNAVIEQIHEDPPGMILLDMRMPKIDGRELFAQIQSDPIGSQLPVVLVTADQYGSTQARAIGAIGYLAKPFDINALFACVERFMGPPATMH